MEKRKVTFIFLVILVFIGITILTCTQSNQKSNDNENGGGSSSSSSSTSSSSTSSSGFIKTIDTNGGNFTSIKVNGANVYISYYNGTLKFAKSIDSGANWTLVTIDSTGDVGKFTSMAIEGSSIYISYYDVTNKDLKLAKSIDSGANWALVTIDSNNDVGTFPSIKIDGNIIYISYYDVTALSLKLAKSTNGGESWSILTIDNSVDWICGAPITINDNNIYVAYYQYKSAGNIKLAKSSDGGINWTVNVIDNIISHSNGINYISLLIQDSIIFVSYVYYSNSTIGQLKFAKSIDAGVNWTKKIIDYDYNYNTYTGSCNSMEINSSGIYISYIKYYAAYFTSYLKLAISGDNGDTWSVNTIDPSTNDVGEASLAVNNNDIYISYYCDDFGEVKLAKSVNGGINW